ncbi:MAG: response regulator [Chloroflexota bacterium]
MNSPQPPLTKDKRILIADDEPITRKMTEIIVKKLGFWVDIAENGLTALEAVQNTTYHVVLIDLQMPEMDGFESIRRIRNDRTIHQPYIIAMSGQVLEGNDDWYLASGIDDYIMKPVDEAKLIQVIVEVTGISLDGKHHHSEKDHQAEYEQTSTIISLEAIENLQDIFGEEASFNIPWLISRFYRNARDLITQAWQAQNACDFGELRRIIHTLKGASATFGSVRLIDLTSTLEGYTDTDLADKSADLLHQIEDAFEQTKQALEVIRYTFIERGDANNDAAIE